MGGFDLAVFHLILESALKWVFPKPEALYSDWLVTYSLIFSTVTHTPADRGSDIE